MSEHGEITAYAPTVSREIHPQGVYIYRISATDRPSIDAWKRACIETNDLIDVTKTVRTMHCANNLGGLITPYANQRIREVMQDSARLRGYTAIVLQRSLTVALVEMLWRQLASWNKTWDMKIFFEEDAALAWLLNQPDK